MIGAEEKKSASKGIFIEWILKLMVATSDMLIRRASGFLITPDDGRRNNRRVIQIEDAPPARLLMRFTYVPPRFVSLLSLSLSFSLEGEGGEGEVILSKPREQTWLPRARGNRYNPPCVSCSSTPPLSMEIENFVHSGSAARRVLKLQAAELPFRFARASAVEKVANLLCFENFSQSLS